jgi:hypothetical protein
MSSVYTHLNRLIDRKCQALTRAAQKKTRGSLAWELDQAHIIMLKAMRTSPFDAFVELVKKEGITPY